MGLRTWLDPVVDLEMIAETAEAATPRSGMALAEFQLPDQPGPIACCQILAASPETSVLLMHVPQQDAHLAAPAEAGASGLLSRNAEAREVIDALRQIAAGREVFTRTQRLRIRTWQDEIGRRPPARPQPPGPDGGPIERAELEEARRAVAFPVALPRSVPTGYELAEVEVFRFPPTAAPSQVHVTYRRPGTMSEVAAPPGAVRELVVGGLAPSTSI